MYERFYQLRERPFAQYRNKRVQLRLIRVDPGETRLNEPGRSQGTGTNPASGFRQAEPSQFLGVLTSCTERGSSCKNGSTPGNRRSHEDYGTTSRSRPEDSD